MTVFSRRSFRALVAFALTVTALVAVVSLPTAATTESPCAALQAWASAYRDASPSLDDVARFDRGHRIALFNAVTPAVRASLWQEQLRRFEQREGLSSTQRALVAEARTLITPALYADDAQAKSAHDTFWARARSSFGQAHERRAIHDLGALSSQYNTKPSAGAMCDCKYHGECASGLCGQGSCSSWKGCGESGTEACSGQCQ